MIDNYTFTEGVGMTIEHFDELRLGIARSWRDGSGIPKQHLIIEFTTFHRNALLAHETILNDKYRTKRVKIQAEGTMNPSATHVASSLTRYRPDTRRAVATQVRDPPDGLNQTVEGHVVIDIMRARKLMNGSRRPLCLAFSSLKESSSIMPLRYDAYSEWLNLRLEDDNAGLTNMLERQRLRNNLRYP